MEKYRNLYETVIKNGYDVRSGVFSAVDENISMKMNHFGEYEAVREGPVVERPLVDEQKLINVSAMADNGLNEDIIGKELFGDVKGIKHDTLLGYYKDLYVGYVKDGDYRKNASSGGIATWVFKELLERKLIDGVIHMKPVDDDSGILFRYEISRTTEEIINGAKTRYYPGELSKVLKAVKENPGRYAVSGLPSFIYELRLLARQDETFKKSIAYTVGLICGHQKSAKYAENLAWQHGIKPGDLKYINFRKKDETQPASMYSLELTGLIDGKETTITRRQNTFYGGDWGHGFFKTKFSDFTDDTLNETSDISLGDAWLPEYTKDSGGNNVIIVRNPDIAKILKDGLKNDKLKLDVVDEKTIIRSQSGLIHHTRDELPYRLHKADKSGEWRPKKRVEASKNIPILKRKVQDLREKIARNSHTLYASAVADGVWESFKLETKQYVQKYKYIYLAIRLKNKGIKGIASIIATKTKLKKS